ncbi:MAG: ABC transporter ATP-binding protein [Acidobacteriota bacterium]
MNDTLRATAPVAVLHGAEKRYSDVTALAGIDLAVRPGEVVALLGPNGAGKTTAVSLLLGLLRPSAGRAELFGRDPQSRLARQRTGAMLQIASVPETLTVREHLTLISSYYPRPRPIAETLELAGLNGLEKRLYGKLSGGQKRRLLFALAICGRPEVLFLDEPSVGLDVEARRKMWASVEAMADDGCTVFLTTHHLEEADVLASRVVVLHRGHIVAEGSSDEVKSLVGSKRVRCLTRCEPADVRTWPGVVDVVVDAGHLVITCESSEDVTRRLLAADPGLSGLEVSAAGLEEAMLQLTNDDNLEEAA